MVIDSEEQKYRNAPVAQNVESLRLSDASSEGANVPQCPQGSAKPITTAGITQWELTQKQRRILRLLMVPPTSGYRLPMPYVSIRLHLFSTTQQLTMTIDRGLPCMRLSQPRGCAVSDTQRLS